MVWEGVLVLRQLRSASYRAIWDYDELSVSLSLCSLCVCVCVLFSIMHFAYEVPHSMQVKTEENNCRGQKCLANGEPKF